MDDQTTTRADAPDDLATRQAAADLSTAPKAPEGDRPVCPTCGTEDVNPSGEVLPHCWKCGHQDDTWPSTDTEARRRANVERRLGLTTAAF